MTVSPHLPATNQDDSQLRLLATLHYVLAGLSAFFSSFFLFHVAWGISIWRGVPLFPGPAHGGAPVPLGIMITFMGTAAVVVGWAFAGCLIVAGRSLAARTRYSFCLVVAGVACLLCNPLGMGLGIFTFIVLFRPSVKQLFGVP
ncbi:MAG TPA: hypothetical protein VER11_26160 [Polyangiaceae bacterium]|nr:hypothetical protein [Polyangiaceae bacterium]